MADRALTLALTAALLTAGAGTAAAVPTRPAPPGPAAPTTGADRPAPGVIVQWREGTSPEARAGVRRAVGLQRRGELPLPATEVVDVPRGGAAEAVGRRLEQDPRVAFAEPHAWLTLSSADPLFPVQWGLENRGQTIAGRAGVAGVDIRAPQAWAAAAARPSAPVLVAITDSGVDVRHPDLAPYVWRNPLEPVNGLDDDRNGLVDDVNGYDFVSGNASVYDDPEVDEHGTHVAGTVGAVRDNGAHVAGVTERLRLLTAKFIGPDGGATSDAVRAVVYASQAGAKVINASWGGRTDSAALQQAVETSPAVFVAAAGNEGRDTDLEPEYPASYGAANVLSVTAVDNTGALPVFSNRGRLTVDVGAPGVDIASTLPDGRSGPFTGTSMAAPHVAGVAAMIRSLRPDLSAGSVVSLIEQTVRPLASLSTTTSTGGIVDAEAAVRAALAGASPAPNTDPPALPSTDGSEQAQPQEACPDGLPSSGFNDVAGNVHRFAIDCAVWYGVVKGANAFRDEPARAVTRGQAASLLAGLVARAGRLPATAPNAFRDDEGSVHEANIDKMASLGLVRGVDGIRYAPDRLVTRGQVATLLVGVQEFLTRSALPQRATPFTDVLLDVHRNSIEKAYTAGLVRGTSPTTYSPGGPTRRDQAASLLARELQELVDAGAIEPMRG